MTEPIYDSDPPEFTVDGPNVASILERLAKCITDIRIGFERWDHPHSRGPGLYFVVERDSIGEFVAPMGNNRWPIEECSNVLAQSEEFLETAQTVALSCDGAIVVHSDGTIEEAMVRVNQLSPAEYTGIENLPYADWMGARHMSALETSTREEVIAAITLSEEDGRVTVFTDGTYEDSIEPSEGSD
jgi:hypothetical protein